MREEFIAKDVTDEGITRMNKIMKKKEVEVADGETMSYEKLYHGERMKHEITKIEASKYLKRLAELQIIIATAELTALNKR